jgi:hypothetical protein
MSVRSGWMLAVALTLGLSASARAQNLGGLGGFNGLGAGNLGGTAIATPGFGLTGFGVPAAVSSGAWGWPGANFGYGGYGYNPYAYGYNPYTYGYGAYGVSPYGGYAMPYTSGYNGVFSPYPIAPPRMVNNLGGVMGAIQGSTGRGTWRRSR